MKPITLALLLLCVSVCVQAQTFKNCKTLGAFEDLHVYNGINLSLEMGNEFSWSADTNTNPDKLDIRIEDSMLYIRKIPGEDYKKEPNIKVTYKNLKNIEGYGKANIVTLNLIKTDSITVTLKSGAVFYGSFDVKYLDANVTEGCLFTADGYANKQIIRTNFKATFSGFELEGIYGDVKATTGSVVKVNITDSLSVYATSGGYVGYKGSPKINENSLLGGKIVNNKD